MSNPHPSVKGRTPGVPNKMSSARVERALQQGKRLPPDNLLLVAENSLAMAARYQPEVTNSETREKRPNPEYNEDRYAFWLDRAREALRDAAPYYSPKLHAVAIATPPSSDDDMSRVDPRETMWRVYSEMRQRGELAMKTVGSVQTDSTPHTAQPEPAVVDEEDNGDGVAA